jgi:trehalose 6-phosphate synthase/phosphatase
MTNSTLKPEDPGIPDTATSQEVLLDGITPGICKLSGNSTYTEEPKSLSQQQPSHPQGNSNSYFGSQDSKINPTEVRSNSTELLRRMSLIDTARPILDATPKQKFPQLKLSGRIISATICIPHSIGFQSGAPWSLTSRRGTSALFDAFSDLAGSGTWDHMLVGWTGEIKPSHLLSNPNDGSTARSVNADGTTSKTSAPASKVEHSNNAQAEAISITRDDRTRLEEQLANDPEGKVVPVWLFDSSQEGKDVITLKDQSRWRRYAEKELYTLFHYKQRQPTENHSKSGGLMNRQWWQDYQRVNQKFADRIWEIYKPGDIIWIHDYHLMLLPSLLRQRSQKDQAHEMYIAYFLHTPFPSSELFRCLPNRNEILSGVLGATMVGFQTYSYARHFSSACTRIVNFTSDASGIDSFGRHISVDVFPIGIDAAKVAKIAFMDEGISKTIAAIREKYQGMKIIVGRDRLDTVRGVSQKLVSYEKFLEKYPKWCGKVVLIQVTSPTSIEEEKEDAGHKIASKVADLVDRINGRYGGLEYTPVFHFPSYVSREDYFALLRLADLALITSVRDGMNTTSLEYVICQKYNHSPLILSEFSGTAGVLTEAMHINPWDHVGVAQAIDEALSMSPQEKAQHHKLLYKQVSENTVQVWTRNFLERLMMNLASHNASIATPELDRAVLSAAYAKAKRRLFMFDYDGTLTPIVKDPLAALPTDRVTRTIKTLAQEKKNNVWIISGRDQDFLNEQFGHIEELGFSAEHGSFIRRPYAAEFENLAEGMDMSWQEEVTRIFNAYTEKTIGSYVERKRIAITWHFRKADHEFGEFQAKVCKEELDALIKEKGWDLEVMNGKMNLEVRPGFANKGSIAKQLVEEYGDGDETLEFVLCLGDDFTDEDMFRSLKNSKLPRNITFSCTVGASSKQTEAYWHLLEPHDVIATVGHLNDIQRELNEMPRSRS